MLPPAACSDAESTCLDGYCTAQCSSDSLEGYCDPSMPCNANIGYVCQAGRCRPPIGAIRVLTNEACDQGEGDTRFWCDGSPRFFLLSAQAPADRRFDGPQSTRQRYL